MYSCFVVIMFKLDIKKKCNFPNNSQCQQSNYHQLNYKFCLTTKIQQQNLMMAILKTSVLKQSFKCCYLLFFVSKSFNYKRFVCLNCDFFFFPLPNLSDYEMFVLFYFIFKSIIKKRLHRQCLIDSSLF